MGISKFVLGIILSMICFTLALTVDQIFTGVSTNTANMFQIVLLFSGLASLGIGFLDD